MYGPVRYFLGAWAINGGRPRADIASPSPPLEGESRVP
jgi:hypothetical protein